MSTRANTVSTFCDIVANSRLITRDHLCCLVNRFQNQSKRPEENQAEELKAFLDFLIDADELTLWQTDLLLMGKHKGFFIGDYVLLTRLSGLLPRAIFEARETKTGKIVSLEINVPSMSSPQKDITHRVVSD